MTIPPEHEKLHHASLQALQEAVDHLPRDYAEMAQLLREVHDHPEEHWPHPVYLVGPEELASGDGLSQAQVVGWQYLAKAEWNRNYAVEVQGDPEGDHCRFAQLGHGPLIDGVCRALEDTSLLERMAAGRLQFSVLIVDEMDILAIWLRADSPERELILAIPPVPPYIKPWPAVYTVEQFQDALRDEARREL